MLKLKTAIPLLLLLFLSVIYIYRQSTRVDNQTSQVSTKNLPALYVKDNTIRRTDNNEAVRLKGVSSMVMAYGGFNLESIMGILNEVKLWNINLLGLFVQPDVLKEDLAMLDEIINWAETNHIYVYLMPRQSDFEDLSTQLDSFPSMMGGLAKRYKQKNNILYGFWAEPHMQWKEWQELTKKIAAEITKEKPDALMIMTGVDFGRTYETYMDLPSKNIILDYHEYRAGNVDELKPFLNGQIDFLWADKINSYPILIGEFGGVWKDGFGSQEDLVYVQLILDEVNRNNLHYSAYSIDNHDGEDVDVEEGIGLINWRTKQPTKKGELIIEDLRNYPPTDF